MTASVLVVTTEPLDLGAGAHTRVVFPDATHHIDDVGSLIIRSSIQGRGNLAAFNPDEWRSVLAGVDLTVTPVTVDTMGQADATHVTVAGVQ